VRSFVISPTKPETRNPYDKKQEQLGVRVIIAVGKARAVFAKCPGFRVFLSPHKLALRRYLTNP
jgi:hypothetical protein